MLLRSWKRFFVLQAQFAAKGQELKSYCHNVNLNSRYWFLILKCELRWYRRGHKWMDTKHDAIHWRLVFMEGAATSSKRNDWFFAKHCLICMELFSLWAWDRNPLWSCLSGPIWPLHTAHRSVTFNSKHDGFEKTLKCSCLQRSYISVAYMSELLLWSSLCLRDAWSITEPKPCQWLKQWLGKCCNVSLSSIQPLCSNWNIPIAFG